MKTEDFQCIEAVWCEMLWKVYSTRNIEDVEGMADVVATQGAFKPNVPSRRCQESTQRFIARVLVTRSSEKKCLPESQSVNRNKMRSTSCGSDNVAVHICVGGKMGRKELDFFERNRGSQPSSGRSELAVWRNAPL